MFMWVTNDPSCSSFFFFFFVSQQAPNFSLQALLLSALSFSLCKKTIMVSERKKGMEKPKQPEVRTPKKEAKNPPDGY